MTKRILSFDDRVQLLTALFKSVEPSPDIEEIKDIVTCLSMDQIKEYMRDVGITVTQTPFGSTIHQTTINSDEIWIERKIDTLYRHLSSKIVGE